MKTTTVYKVVRKTNDKKVYQSAVMNGRNDGMPRLNYAIGKTTTKPIDAGPLFAFSTIDQAQHFIGHDPEFSIFRAKATNVQENAFFGYYGRKMNGTRGFFFGTVFCDSIKLVKDVTP